MIKPLNTNFTFHGHILFDVLINRIRLITEPLNNWIFA